MLYLNKQEVTASCQNCVRCFTQAGNSYTGSSVNNVVNNDAITGWHTFFFRIKTGILKRIPQPRKLIQKHICSLWNGNSIHTRWHKYTYFSCLKVKTKYWNNYNYNYIRQINKGKNVLGRKKGGTRFKMKNKHEENI